MSRLHTSSSKARLSFTHIVALAIALHTVVPASAGAISATSGPPVIDLRPTPPLEGEPPDSTPRRYRAVPFEGDAPSIDGRLTERVWQEASFTSDFLQREPEEGEPATHATRVAIRHDGDDLFLAARMRRSAPGRIRRQTTRRDEAGTSARLYIHLDPEIDRRSALVFGVTAAGTRIDYTLSEDANDPGDRDFTYDPIWDVAVRADSAGWIVEARIPFSEMRLTGTESSEWGLQFQRIIPSENEEDHWQLIPETRDGWVSRFGRLSGLSDIDYSRVAEVRPYVATRGEWRGELSPVHPLRSNPALELRTGGDVSLGIGSLTLDATVNPDFGQVQADPARLNLSAYELFFQEHRPFFTEGSRYLTGNEPDYFYSRRIGAPPHGHASGRYVRSPNNTTILAAAKLTGRVDGDLSVGALGAVTQEEHAVVVDSAGGPIHRSAVEPRTGYGVVRVGEQLAGGSTVGLSLTGVRRDLPPGSALADELPRTSLAGGGDWNLRFGDGRYVLRGFFGLSHVRGSRPAMLEKQLSSVRYFQRPDAGHVVVDSARTSLTGWAGGAGVQKRSGEHWLWNVVADASSPGFALNDLGRLRTTDEVSLSGKVTYRETDPGDLFRRWRMSVQGRSEWNFGGTRRFAVVSPHASVQWPNFMRTRLRLFYRAGGMDDRRTRGGPLVEDTDVWGLVLGLRTNPRDPNRFEAGGLYRRSELGGWTASARVEGSVRPSPDLRLSFGPRLRLREEPRQYVATLPDGPMATYGRRYVFSRIHRTTLSAELRLDYAFTPDVSVELFAQPFAARGDYVHFGELPRPGAKRLLRYGEGDSRIVERGDGFVEVERGGSRFTVPERDFSLFSFRSTAVLRWQWRAGSTFFLAWQQNRRRRLGLGSPVGVEGWLEPFGQPGDHTLTAKVTYWLRL